MTDSDSSTSRSTCTVSERWMDSTVIMDCAGELDVVTAPVLARHIEDALSGGPTAIVVDLSHVDFLAARGMNVLIGANSCLHGRVPMHPTLDTALAALHPSTAA